MNKIIAVIIILAAILGVYYYINSSINKYSVVRRISLDEAENLLSSCQIKSFGQTKVNEINDEIELVLKDQSYVRVSSQYEKYLKQKAQDIKTKGKCPDLVLP